MYAHETAIRVRYGETDQMGYVYYGNYAVYLEVARVEMLRHLGLTYKMVEEKGILMPVVNFQITYLKPAFYDDLLRICTMVPDLPGRKIDFRYEIFNAQEALLSKAETTLVFIDRKSMKSVRAPEFIMQAFRVGS